jgi:hypothetical protein
MTTWMGCGQTSRRAGERPAVGEKYQAIAAMRELTGVLRTIAFEAVYDAPE